MEKAAGLTGLFKSFRRFMDGNIISKDITITGYDRAVIRGGKALIDDVLKRAEVFLGLNDGDLKVISSLPSSRQESHKPGNILFRAGQDAKNVYVLKEGQIDLMVEIPPGSDDRSKWVTVDLITKGDLFGWSALVRPHLYILSAVCSKPSKVIVINGAEIQALFDQNYYIGYKVLQGLTRVIGSRYRGLQQLLINGKRWPFIEKHSGT